MSPFHPFLCHISYKSNPTDNLSRILYSLTSILKYFQVTETKMLTIHNIYLHEDQKIVEQIREEDLIQQQPTKGKRLEARSQIYKTTN
jgi:hypothetical protein